MTIEELIAVLSTFNPKLPVTFDDECWEVIVDEVEQDDRPDRVRLESHTTLRFLHEEDE